NGTVSVSGIIDERDLVAVSIISVLLSIPGSVRISDLWIGPQTPIRIIRAVHERAREFDRQRCASPLPPTLPSRRAPAHAKSPKRIEEFRQALECQRNRAEAMCFRFRAP